MNDDLKEGGEGRAPEELSDRYIDEAVLFAVNWHAATVNMRLYPKTSTMVTDTVENARLHLQKLFEEGQRFSVSVLENSLLVNDVRLEELEQQKAPIRAFIQWMNERGLTNLEFRDGVTPDELNIVFEVLSAASDKDHRLNLADKLIDEGVTSVSINQRVYVAITAGEDVTRAGPLDALKDELLMRYLMGKVELGDVEDRELVDVLSDSGKVGGLLSTFISEEGNEGGILVRSQKAEEALNRLSDMIDQLEDPGLREMLSDQIGSIVAEMSPKEMTSVLTGEGPDNLNIRKVRERVVTMLSDQRLLEMVDSLIDEYVDMKAEADELEISWQKDKLRNLNELLIEVREERGDAIAEVIDTKLEGAGIEEERDPATGIRVLSAFQLLGGPIDEEYVELVDGIDQTVPDQIKNLYEMEENELATGMLAKLADNLAQDSPNVRRFAATLVKDTLSSLEPEFCLQAAGILEPRLLEDVEAETDYAAYIPQVDSIAVLARCYMMEGNADRATSIIDLLEEQANLDQGKGPELVKHASAVLERLTGPEGMIDIQALLLEKDNDKKSAMVKALADIGVSALQPVVDLVKDRGQIELRELALEAIQMAGEPGIEALIAELAKENPWYVHRNILNVVADLKLTEAVEQVGAMASSPDERIRREALRSLARIGSRESVSVVQAAASDQSAAVRRTAVRVLGMFGDSSVALFLIDIINGQGPRGREEEQAVMEAACLAIGDLHDSQYLPQLAELLAKGGLFRKARPDEIRAAACVALGTIGDPEAVSTLEKAMKDSSIMVSSSAEKAIRKLSGGITIPEPITVEEAEQLGLAPPPGQAEKAVEPGPAPAGPAEFRPPPHPESTPETVVAPETVPPPPQPVLEPPGIQEAAPVTQPQVHEPPVVREPEPVAPPPATPEPQVAETAPELQPPTPPEPPVVETAPELQPPTTPDQFAAPAPWAEAGFAADVDAASMATAEEPAAPRAPGAPEWVEMETTPTPHWPEEQVELEPGAAAGPLEHIPDCPPPPFPPDDLLIESLESEFEEHALETEPFAGPLEQPSPEQMYEGATELEQPAPSRGEPEDQTFDKPLEQAPETIKPPPATEAPSQNVEVPPEWRRPGKVVAPPMREPEPALRPDSTADWPLPDYHLVQPPPPASLDPEPEGEQPLPPDEDFAPGRMDQPSTFERLLQAPPPATLSEDGEQTPAPQEDWQTFQQPEAQPAPPVQATQPQAPTEELSGTSQEQAPGFEPQEPQQGYPPQTGFQPPPQGPDTALPEWPPPQAPHPPTGWK